jgi:hypothetical protein
MRKCILIHLKNNCRVCASPWCFASPILGVGFLTVDRPVDQCIHRASRVFEVEGYSVSPGGNNNVYGTSGHLKATIRCTAGPGGSTQVGFVVAADAGSSVDVGQELNRLQHRLQEFERDRDWDRRR